MSFATQHIDHLILQLKRLTNRSVDREVIHDLRVIVKRLKALWLIHPVADSIPFKNSFPHIRKLFRLGARTRDLQVIKSCLETLPDFSKYPHLDELIQTEIKKEKKSLKTKLETSSFRNEVLDELIKYKQFYRITSGYLMKLNRKNYKVRVEEHMSRINPRDADQLHDLRKMLKNQIYQSEAFHSHHDLAKDPVSGLNLQTIQHKLGFWHDWWNTVHWLNIHSQDPETPNTELIKQVKKKESEIKRELMRNIRLYLLHKQT
jgi:CHAD domain-containing protein